MKKLAVLFCLSWTFLLGNPQQTALAASPPAEYAATGEGFIGNLYRRMASTVSLRWTRTYDSIGDEDHGNGVALAADGSIYVTGSTPYFDRARPGWVTSLLLQKYSPDGALSWMKKSHVFGYQPGHGIAVAADGSIYVTGNTMVQGANMGVHYNLLLQKHSPDGALRWAKTYRSDPNFGCEGYGVAVAADGSIYVTGSTEFAGAYGAKNLLLLKYSPNGALRWVRTYNGGILKYDDVGFGVAVAADDSIYVAGYTKVAGQSENLLLRKYSPDGALLWAGTYNGADNGDDVGKGVVVAKDGSIYVAGDIGIDSPHSGLPSHDEDHLSTPYGDHESGSHHDLLLLKYK